MSEPNEYEEVCPDCGELKLINSPLHFTGAYTHDGHKLYGDHCEGR